MKAVASWMLAALLGLALAGMPFLHFSVDHGAHGPAGHPPAHAH